MTQTVQFLCMSSKTISLRGDAYEALKRAKRPGESFTDVVLRARWEESSITGAELMALYRARGPFLDEDALDRVEAANADDAPPADKWADT